MVHRLINLLEEDSNYNIKLEASRHCRVNLFIVGLKNVTTVVRRHWKRHKHEQMEIYTENSQIIKTKIKLMKK